MFSPAQASVSLRPLPPIPTQAMFSLLLRFCPRKSVGTPKANAPAAREPVLMNSRRPMEESKEDSGIFIFRSVDGNVSTHAKAYTHRAVHEQVPCVAILFGDLLAGNNSGAFARLNR